MSRVQPPESRVQRSGLPVCLFVKSKRVFVDTRLYFVQYQFFYLSFFIFFSAQTCILADTKFLFWTMFSMLCHGDIFSSSCSNKNIITCQEKIKISLLCNTKSSLFFVHHKFFIYSFYTAHWQHADPQIKNHLIHFFVFTHLPDIGEQLLRVIILGSLGEISKILAKSCSGKKLILLSSFNLCFTSVKGSYFRKI